jgi:hypothetical protein
MFRRDMRVAEWHRQADMAAAVPIGDCGPGAKNRKAS